MFYFINKIKNPGVWIQIRNVPQTTLVLNIVSKSIKLSHTEQSFDKIMAKLLYKIKCKTKYLCQTEE